MKIYKEKSEYHELAWEFTFKPDAIDWIHNFLQAQRPEGDGWKDISFDKEAKKWRFSKLEFVNFIKQKYPEVEIEPGIQAGALETQLAKQGLEQAQTVKNLTDSNLIVQGLKESLYNYQKLGVEFLTLAHGRGILADAPGVGKTAQALGFLAHNKIAKTLVICPASVKYAWESEVKKWTKLKSCVIDNKNAIDVSLEFLNDIAEEYNIFIINYDLLRKYGGMLQALHFDCLIVDEFHAIKNNKAQRTKLVKAIALKIPKVILLSGTPMLNRPVELFNGLQILDPHTWNNWFDFTKRYCGAYRGRWGWDTSGATNIEELRQRIEPYFLRRTKEEVLKELPPKNYIEVPIRLPEEIKKLYYQAEANLAEFLKTYKTKSQEDIRRSLAAEKLVKLNELRQLTTKGKVETAEDLIDQLLENEEKVIVFSIYNEPLEYLRNKYKTKSVILTGKTPVSERGELIRVFQANPGVKVFLGGTASAGTGITLTAASNVVFIDYDWVPAIMEQASDRAHRIGQTAESVNIYQIYAKDTIDDYMVKLLAEKRNLISYLIDGKVPEQKEQSVVETIFKNVERKYEDGKVRAI